MADHDLDFSPATIEYAREPTAGNLSISGTPGNMTVAVHPARRHYIPRGIGFVVLLMCLAGMLMLFKQSSLASMPAITLLVFAGILAVLTIVVGIRWVSALFPGQYHATAAHLEIQNGGGRRPFRIAREEIIAVEVTKGELLTNNRSSVVCLRLRNNQLMPLGRGTEGEVEALANAVRRGLLLDAP